MDAQQRFMREHKELLNLIISTVQELRERGDYNSIALLSAALAGTASALMEECNAVMAEINRELNS